MPCACSQTSRYAVYILQPLHAHTIDSLCTPFVYDAFFCFLFVFWSFANHVFVSAGACPPRPSFALSFFLPSTELSLTVPIVNTLAFLFTVIGEWWVESKVISRGMFSAPTDWMSCRFVPVLVHSAFPLTTPQSRHLHWHGSIVVRYRSVCPQQDQVLSHDVVDPCIRKEAANSS